MEHQIDPAAGDTEHALWHLGLCAWEPTDHRACPVPDGATDVDSWTGPDGRITAFAIEGDFGAIVIDDLMEVTMALHLHERPTLPELLEMRLHLRHLVDEHRAPDGPVH